MRRLLYAAILLLAINSTAWAQPARGVAWAWVSGTTASPSYQHNSAGGAITVTNPSAGSYIVNIPNMGTSGGLAQVVAYNGNHYCNIWAWAPSGTTQQVGVNCYTAAGVAANGAFSVLFYKENRAATQWSDGYLWADQPSTPSYTPSASYQWNSRGGSNTVVRTAVGRYTASFPGLGPLTHLGNVMVTAYGSGNTARCRVDSWSGSPDVLVNVACDTPGGVAIDSQYDLSFISDTAFGVNQGQEQMRGAFVWANDAAASSYTPSLFYQYNSAGGPIRARRTGVGQYQVDIPGLIAGNSSNVQVTRYQGAGYCNVFHWEVGPNNGTTVFVSCYSTSGAAQDARYALTYLTNQPATAELPSSGGPARAKAWVWSDGSGTNATPNAFYQFNSSGGVNSVTRLFAGGYRVDLPGLGTAGGIVHVNAYAGTSYCKAHSWGPNLTTQEIYVLCFNPAGSTVDSQFSVLFYKEARTGSTFNAGHTRALMPIASAAYTPPSAYSWNGRSLTNSVTRVSTGRYNVAFNGLVQTPNGGSVMVTPYGGVATRCKVSAWAGILAQVACYQTNGTLIDSEFGISYVVDVAFGADTLASAFPGGYAWADNSAAASYQPSTSYRFNSEGGTFLATRSSAGAYGMEFGLLKAANKTVPIVTAYGEAPGETDVFCRPDAWVAKAGDPGTRIEVGCFNAAGTRVDSRYTVVYMTTPPPTMALDKTSLRFGAVTTGSAFLWQTSAQVVRLTQTGPGTVTWTATSNQPWLQVSPASGTGAADLSINVMSVGGLPVATTVAGAITLTFTGAANTPGPVNVSLNLIQPGTQAAPFGVVDTPLENTTGVTGAIPFTGWALDDVEVTRVSVCRAAFGAEVAPVDPNCGGAAQIFVGTAVFIDGARPDVAAVFPTFPISTRAGWGFMVLTNMLPNQGNGTYLFYMHAQDKDGHSTLLGTRTITCANASATKPFGAIDTPTQGGGASGSAFVNFGWALTPLPKTIPTNGSTITVQVDGVTLGTATYNNFRSDIATLFPGFNNSGGAVGFRIIDTTSLSNGLHTIQWVVSDDGGAVEGIGSRFFTVSNSAGAPLTADERVTADATSIAAIPLDTEPLTGRRGWDLAAPRDAFAPSSSGRSIVRSEEVSRVELELGPGWDAGYLRTSDGLTPLPIGSHLDPNTGVFTWAPGVAFVGTYDFVFVQRKDGLPAARREVRILLAPKGSGRVGPQVVIDTPTSQQDVGQPFMLGGWAADLSAATGTGIATLHAWAYPLAGGPPVFLGATSYGGARPDVAAVHGEQFEASGFGLVVQGLAHGHYDLAVFPWSTGAADFAPAAIVRVTVR